MWEITEGQRKTKKDVSSSFIYPQSDNDGPDLRFVTCTVSRADEAWLGRQIPIYLTLPRVVAVVDGLVEVLFVHGSRALGRPRVGETGE